MKKHNGFTLIELLVTIGILAIIVTIATPALDNFTISNKRVAQINGFVGTLNFARSEAIKRNASISVCGSDASVDPRVCDTASWHLGYIVFLDVNEDGVFDAGETLLYESPALTGASVTLTEAGGGTAVTFISNGFVKAAAEFKRCDIKGAATARGVILTSTGRPRLSIDSGDADTIHEDSSGTNLTCP